MHGSGACMYSTCICVSGGDFNVFVVCVSWNIFFHSTAQVCVYATASGCCAGLGVGMCMSNYIAETDSKW